MVQVSIHAPRAERDSTDAVTAQLLACFNPRAPGGARLGINTFTETVILVSIHAPRAERD